MRRLTTALAGTTFAIAALVGAAAPASATTGVTPEVSCYKTVAGGYEVFFGYTNPTGSVKSLPVGGDNKVKVNHVVVKPANQPSRFEVGTKKAVFSVTAPTTGSDAEAEWEIGAADVEFDSSNLSRYARCGSEVSLPADGNGLIPVVVVGGVALVGGGLLVLRRRNAASPKS